MVKGFGKELKLMLLKQSAIHMVEEKIIYVLSDEDGSLKLM